MTRSEELIPLSVVLEGHIQKAIATYKKMLSVTNGDEHQQVLGRIDAYREMKRLLITMKAATQGDQV